MMVGRTVRLWPVLALLPIVLALVATVDGSSSSFGHSRLRRVHKSTYSEANPPERATVQTVGAMSRTQKKPPPIEGLHGTARSTIGKRATTTTMSGLAVTATTLRQRVDETVQKVRARSKEIRMEQERKRVDRKLRRDQKKLEREQPAPINPHNLQMPECPAGKFYNGRRCVAMAKMPKH